MTESKNFVMPKTISLNRMLTYGLAAGVLASIAVGLLYNKFGVEWGSFYFKSLWTIGGAAFAAGVLFEICSQYKLSQNPRSKTRKKSNKTKKKSITEKVIEEQVDIANILTLIATKPNQRSTAKSGDMVGNFDSWFDGGAVSQREKGITNYRFDDGTRAYVNTLDKPSTTIEFTTGKSIHIQHE